MKTMMMTDLITSKRYLVSQTAISLVVAVFMTLAMGNLYVIIPVIACMVPFSLVFSLLAFDERNGWERFRLTLPMSRNQVICGRYMSAFALTLAGTLMAALLFAVCISLMSVISGFVPLNEDLAAQLTNVDWQAILLVLAAPMGLSMLFFMVVLPLSARFGLTKSIRLIPLALFALVMLAVVAFQTAGRSIPPFILDAVAWLATPTGTIVGVVVGLLIVLALYGISCFIAMKVYAKREF